MSDYLNKVTILYVEDEQDIRDGYTRAINRLAKELYIATNGKEGLEKYQEHDIDIVITDIRMPQMDGLSMIEKIKEIKPSQKIIITSAHSDSESFLKAIALQVDGYLLKPVDKNILKEKIISFSKQIVLEKELEIKNKQLIQKEKLASMGEMITNIAHNWRQPLSLISTLASNLQIKKEINELDDNTFFENIEKILLTTQDLSNTINEFNSFMNIQDTLLRFYISKTIEKILNIQKQAIDNSGVNIILDLDDSLEITNFENSLIQSIVAIGTNAIEALEKSEIKDKYIFINLKKEQDQVVLSIQDNAGGISEEFLPKIFEAYTTTKHQYVGTGLGLYTTYGLIIEKMNCSIEVNNLEYTYNDKNYKGANFTIILNDYE
jgi:YesN/AraC family two-component response regulator